MKFLMTLMLGIGLMAAPAMAQDVAPGAGSQAGGGADTNMEIFIQKVKADKKLLVASNMDLSDAEGKKFWPLYDGYQKELEQLNQRLGRAIKAYADVFNEGRGMISDDAARNLLKEALAIEEAELKLKRTYADKISKVLPATKTTRYIQIENKIRAIIKFELARQIPLVY